MIEITRPGPDEYDAFYAGYVAKAPDSDVLGVLSDQLAQSAAYFRKVPTEREGYRYRAGKWSIREVLGHITDVERVFAFRALWFARRDPASLPGMEQDDWMAGANFAERSLEDLINEFQAARRASLALFGGFNAEMFARRGRASGCEFTVRALPYIMAGHELHHMQVLRERYR